MSRRLRAALILLASMAAAGWVSAQTPDGNLEAELQKIVEEVKAGDMASVVDHMYPPFVEAGGGAKALKMQAAIAQAKLAAKGLKIVRFEFIKPYQTVITDQREYRIIPDHSVMQLNARLYEVKSFWLAIRDRRGGPWRYVEGGGLTRMSETRNHILPDLIDTPLPEVESKALN